MESLSEVLHSLPLGSRLKQAEEKARLLLQDPLIVKWRAKYPQLTDHDLKLHLGKLYQYSKDYQGCRSCPGLAHCPNELEGHATRLTVETSEVGALIYDSKVACPQLLSQQSQDAIRRRIRSFYVDQQSLEKGYSSEEILELDQERSPAVMKLLKYMMTVKEQGLQPKGLYIEGALGTGKTFLMCYMLYELAKVGLTGVIIYMPDFAEDLKAMFGEPQRLKETIDLLKDTDLLVFDDIGAENMNPWLRDHVLGTILNYRMNRKPTFFTSNYELAGLERHFSFTSKDGDEEFKGQRIMDRIRHYVDVVEVHGTNKRGSQAG